MSEPFLGEISMIGFNFPPRGWAYCDGELLPIGQNQSLYAVLGTTFGGDGRSTFALPDLRGRTPIGVGQGTNLSNRREGDKVGSQQVTLTAAEIPSHTHTLRASSLDQEVSSPTNNILAKEPAGILFYAAPNDPKAMHAGSLSSPGSQGHENRQPYLAVRFIIALEGTFPPRN